MLCQASPHLTYHPQQPPTKTSQPTDKSWYDSAFIQYNCTSDDFNYVKQLQNKLQEKKCDDFPNKQKAEKNFNKCTKDYIYLENKNNFKKINDKSPFLNLNQKRQKPNDSSPQENEKSKNLTAQDFFLSFPSQNFTNGSRNLCEINRVENPKDFLREDIVSEVLHSL